LLSQLGVFWAIINKPSAGGKKNNPEMKSPLHILHLEDDVMDAELVTLLADGVSV
jgi:hypothetical protein